MRSFTFITLAALALGASAASVNKRAISTPVQTCINDIIAVSDQLGVVTADVNSFTSSSGYSGALSIHSKEQVLETKLKQAGTDCCAVSGTVTDEEAQAVLDVVNELVPDVTAALASIVAKKPQFDAILLATALVKNDIKNLNTQTNTLDTCLVAKTPSAYLAEANDLVAQINAAFASARSAYGI